MVALLTLGESLGVGSTPVGTPLSTATGLRFSTAGAEATVAIGMSRLGHSAAWIGTVGADAVGRRVLRDLQAEGVRTDFARTVADAPTGFMLRDQRSPEFVAVSYYRSGLAGACLEPSDVEAAFAALDPVDVLHVTGITPVLGPSCRAAVFRAIELATAAGTTVSFDVNHRRTLTSWETARADAQRILAAADLVFVGDDELDLLTEQTDPAAAATELAARGPAEVVVKLGARGARVATAAGERCAVDARPVAVADVIGAGDSFVAGYLAARADGLPVVDRLAWATTCAAATVGTHGDWEGLPHRSELALRTNGGTIR